MQVTEMSNDGLKRELQVKIDAAELEGKLESKLESMKGQVQIKGFRPGKVPMNYLRKLYGKSVMAEVVRDTVLETNNKVLTDRNERPAFEPDIEFPKDEQEVNDVMDGKADLAYKLRFEVLPDVELADFSAMTIVRELAEPDEKDIEESITRLAENSTSYTKKDGVAEDGDRVTMDFEGKIEGVAFEGGKAEGATVVLGQGQFIPGFEEGIKGVKAGDERQVNATFPEDYGAKELAGKDALFDVTVTEIGAPGKPEINDEFAKTVGFDTVDALRDAVKGQLMGDIDTVVRSKLKKTLFDQLDEAHSFTLPATLIENEINDILEREKRKKGEQAHDPDHVHDENCNHDHDDKEDSEEEIAAKREKMTPLAERRVRVGLVLSEIGRKHEITLTDEEVERAIQSYVGQFSGYEQQMYEYVQKTPEAQAEVRAPLFEDKVVDFLVELVKVEDKKVSAEELFKVPDDEEDAA